MPLVTTLPNTSNMVDGYVNAFNEAGSCASEAHALRELVAHPPHTQNAMQTGALVGAMIGTELTLTLDILVGDGSQLTESTDAFNRFCSLGIMGTVGYGINYAAALSSEATGAAAGTLLSLADMGLKPQSVSASEWVMGHAQKGASLLSNTVSAVLTGVSSLGLNTVRQLSTTTKAGAVLIGAAIGAGVDALASFFSEAKN